MSDQKPKYSKPIVIDLQAGDLQEAYALCGHGNSDAGTCWNGRGAITGCQTGQDAKLGCSTGPHARIMCGNGANVW